MTAPLPGPAPAPLLDLQQLMVAVRRRRRLWMSAALLGLIAGALVAVFLPPPPTAVTRLLIVHESDQPSDTGSLMRTDVALLETARIAAAALERLGSAERPEDFLATYEATGLTSNVLELKVKATSDGEAVASAQALADAFVADHVQRVKAAADAEAQALIIQRDRAQAELAEVDAAIADTPASTDDETAAVLESLYARRADLASKVSNFGTRAEEAAIGAPRVAAGTQVVDAPRAMPRALPTAAAVNAGIGFVLGLVAGLALTAAATVVRDRPVLRRDIAEHLGASVIAQLPAPRRGPARLWRRSHAVAERNRVAGTLARAIHDGPAAVSVLELGCQRTAVALAVDIAQLLAADCSVTMIDGLPGRRLRRLAGRAPDQLPIVELGRPLPAEPRVRAVGVGSIRPGTAWTDLRHLGTETLLVVRVEHANTSWLHTVARQLADAQLPVLGVILVNPDPKDRTDGWLWDGLHTALRDRAARAAGSQHATRTAAKASRGEHPASEQQTPAPGAANGSTRTDDYPTDRLPVVRSAALEDMALEDMEIP